MNDALLLQLAMHARHMLWDMCNVFFVRDIPSAQNNNLYRRKFISFNIFGSEVGIHHDHWISIIDSGAPEWWIFYIVPS